MAEEGHDGGIVAEVTKYHGHSTQPESQQVMAVLQAMVEVIRGEGWQVSPTALFAATMTAMDRPDTLLSPQVGGRLLPGVIRSLAKRALGSTLPHTVGPPDLVTSSNKSPLV